MLRLPVCQGSLVGMMCYAQENASSISAAPHCITCLVDQGTPKFLQGRYLLGHCWITLLMHLLVPCIQHSQQYVMYMPVAGSPSCK